MILSLVAFLLGGTIYFSLSVQDNPDENLLTKMTKADNKDVPEVKGEKTVAYLTNEGTNPPSASSSPTIAISSMPNTGVGSGGPYGTGSGGPYGMGTTLPTTVPTSAETKGGLIATFTPSPTVMQLPTQKSVVVTLPVAGAADDIGKIAVGAGALILAAFLF